MAKSLIVTFIVRGGLAFGALFVLYVVSHLYDAIAVANLVLLQSLLLGSALFCRLGMDGALMRFVGSGEATSVNRHYLRLGLGTPVAAGVVTAILVGFFASTVQSLLGTELPDAAIFLTAFAVPPFTYSLTYSGLLKGLGRPVSASLQENGAVLLLAGVMIALLALFFDLSAELVIPLSLCVSAWIIAAKGVFELVRLLESTSNPDEISERGLRPFFRSSKEFFLIGINRVIGQAGLLLLCGSMMDVEAFGQFAAAERVALSVAFVLIVVNTVYPRRFSRSQALGGYPEVMPLARSASGLSLVLSMPLVLLMILAPRQVLSTLGDGFEQASGALIILALAHLVTVVMGGASLVLAMAGREVLVRNYGIAANVAGIVTALLFVPSHGILGAAWAFGISLIVNYTLCWVALRRITGEWLYPEVGRRALSI